MKKTVLPILLMSILTACQPNNPSNIQNNTASQVNQQTSINQVTNTSNNILSQKINSANVSDNLKQFLKESQANFISASDSFLNDFQVVTISPAAYPDIQMQMTIHKSGEWVFDENARLVSTKTGQVADVALKQKQDLSAIQKYKGVGFDKNKTFTLKKGNGERKIAVFTDPDCPFCRRLETNLAQMNNIEITYIYLPIPELHPQAEDKVNKLWAVDNKEKAWLDFLATGNLPEKSNGQKYDYEYMKQLQKEFKVNGTPTLFNIRSGNVTVGALELQDLENFANEK